MSKIPMSRLLAEIDQRQARAKQTEDERRAQPDSHIGKKSLTVQDKREIWATIQTTSEKVAELIELLKWCNKSDQGWHDYYYEPRWGYSQSQLKKIRPLKNDVTAWYFAIWEKLRVHSIGTDKQIQEYYLRIRYFKQYFHATQLTSSSVREFHKSIQGMVVPILNKAFKEK